MSACSFGHVPAVEAQFKSQVDALLDRRQAQFTETVPLAGLVRAGDRRQRFAPSQ
ncbi:hypothetical protein [Streptomyces violaceorubidus]|uniref:hypothetical protein n=1 Tax=Streptomyces violaceorubidus TaxID=284042 RepID=UPI000A9628B3|nr:hypothetical protein [Streptomyces violaceorubidus]